MIGQNLKNIYVIDGKELSKAYLSREEKKKLGHIDLLKFGRFRLAVLKKIGSQGYGTIKIYPENKFVAVDAKGTIINL